MASVGFAEYQTGNGLLLGEAQLNVASTLNSLSLEMIRLLDQRLRQWAQREEVVAVCLTGAGDKAFCAGGDIQALYRAMSANHAAAQVVDRYPFEFFEEEYRLDYCLHTYPKPLLTLGHGIVMGGGLGLLGGSRYRVLTDKSRLAVPEITIGLFPDAGGSWLLRQMPLHQALFLGLTGSQVNATDGLLTGMGTHVIAHDTRDTFVDEWRQLTWSTNNQNNLATLDHWLEALPAVELPNSELEQLEDWSPSLLNFQDEIDGVLSQQGRTPWIDRGLDNLKRGCPTTAGIVFEQIRRVQDMNLADSFRMELCVGTHCAMNHDFAEGVRALLIDKDNAPQWKFGNLSDLQWSHVLAHFLPPPETYWQTHPLSDLGQ